MLGLHHFTAKGLTFSQAKTKYEGSFPPIKMWPYLGDELLIDLLNKGTWIRKNEHYYNNKKPLDLEDFMTGRKWFPEGWNEGLAKSERLDKYRAIYKLPNTYRFNAEDGRIRQTLKLDTDKKFECALCLEMKPTNTLRNCRQCDWSICFSCYKGCVKTSKGWGQMTAQLYPLGDNGARSLELQPRCPQCRGEGTYALQGTMGSPLFPHGDDDALPYNNFYGANADKILSLQCRTYVDKYNEMYNSVIEIEKHNEIVAKRNLIFIAHSTELNKINDEIMERELEIEKLKQLNKEAIDRKIDWARDNLEIPMISLDPKQQQLDIRMPTRLLWEASCWAWMPRYLMARKITSCSRLESEFSYNQRCPTEVLEMGVYHISNRFDDLANGYHKTEAMMKNKSKGSIINMTKKEKKALLLQLQQELELA